MDNFYSVISSMIIEKRMIEDTRVGLKAQLCQEPVVCASSALQQIYSD